MVIQTFKKFPALDGNGEFITALNKAVQNQTNQQPNLTSYVL
jgi:hypothetical protein